MAEMGGLGRSGFLVIRQPNESMRLIIATLTGLVFGFLITSYIQYINSAFTTPAAWTSVNQNSPKIYVPTNPRGAESLAPGIIVSKSDFYLRRLWGDPSEDLPMKQKYLVTFTVGLDQKNNIDAAVKKFSGNFTILLFHYDGRASEWEDLEWSKRAIHVSARKQTKWWYAKRFLHPDIVAPYEYIFIWDEDLGVEHFDAEKYIVLVKKHGLEISQPSLEPNKGLTWQMTKRRGDREIHKETEERPSWCNDLHLPPCAAFVEIMAPVFSRDAWRCVWNTIENDLVHRRGLDFALKKCVEVISPQIFPVRHDISYHEQPVQILDRKDKLLRHRSISLVKVLWKDHNIEEATWEREDEMRRKYPHLFSGIGSSVKGNL